MRGSQLHLLAVCTGAAALAASAIGATVGCVPVFSDLQGARVLAPGKTEVTPSISTIRASDSSGAIQSEVGLQLATGLESGVELRGRYERVGFGEFGDFFEDNAGLNAFAGGLKIALMRDRVALYLPIGFAVGDLVETSKSFVLAPTLLGTLPVTPGRVDANASVKYLIPLSSGRNLTAVNVGLAMGPDLECWALRPEVGVLFVPGEEGYFTQFSLGLSFAVR